MEKGFDKLNFGVDGDSITAGGQWAQYVYEKLGMASFHNVAVGSAVWYKRRFEHSTGTIVTQDWGGKDFAGISDGWLPTEDASELQKRANNCAVVHIQRFISDVKSGKAAAPDIFAFAMGTNDAEDCFGDPEKALKGKSLEEADVDLFTEAGAMRWCIQRIYEEFPDVRIFVLTPIQAADPLHNAKTEKQINDIFKRVCGAMSVQLIDCFHNSGICEKFEVLNSEGKYLKDGLHPKENGQCLQGAFAAKEIRGNMF